MLQKENSVQVVDFVAERSCQKILAANFERLALQVLRAHGHKLRTDNIPAKTGNRQTTLFFAHFAFSVNDFRVHQHDLRFGVLPARDVDHRETQALPDLRRRSPTPCAAYIVANMSSASCSSSESNFWCTGV